MTEVTKIVSDTESRVARRRPPLPALVYETPLTAASVVSAGSAGTDASVMKAIDAAAAGAFACAAASQLPASKPVIVSAADSVVVSLIVATEKNCAVTPVGVDVVDGVRDAATRVTAERVAVGRNVCDDVRVAVSVGGAVTPALCVIV